MVQVAGCLPCRLHLLSRLITGQSAVGCLHALAVRQRGEVHDILKGVYACVVVFFLLLGTKIQENCLQKYPVSQFLLCACLPDERGDCV